MSNRRVKAIDYDDDDLGDYDDGGYEEPGGEELSQEDKEQMRIGTAKIREILGTSHTLQDDEIQEALWHYYYDIPKSVSYLKNKSKPKEPSVPKAPKLSDTKIHPTTKPLLQSAIDFFSDCPWLEIPEHRRALILVEPSCPRGGLLGGSSKEGKMSKLAALAAKRRQKENINPTPATLAESSESADYTTRLSKLTLAQAVPPSKKQKTSQENERPIEPVREPELVTPTEEDKILSPIVTKTGSDSYRAETPLVGRAAPSIFAQTILASSLPSDLSPKLHLPSDNQNFFDFTEPSPDDIINRAQRTKAGPPSKPKKKDASKAKATAEVTDGVSKLNIQEPSKVKSKNIDVVSEYKKTKRKNAANFVVIGHVDAGKSTLMGRLLFDLKAVDQRTLDKYKKEAERIGKGSFAFAWVLDEGSEERERGVTIDIATNRFETEKTSFTILDAPGHQDFVPNMIAGASQADFAVLVIDASGGNFESGLRGQTKEHALLVRSIGVQRIIVAVNKMDMADWDKDRFTDIQQQMSAFLISAGFQAKNLAFVPCSGLEGSNILNRAEDGKSTWYKGHTLVEELDLSEPVSYTLDKPLRMTIADVFRGGIQNPVSISGRLEAGTIQIGEQIQVMPSGEMAMIKSLEVDYEPREWAVAGQNVTLNLADIDPIHLRTGDVVCTTVSPIQNLTKFKAKVLSFNSLTPQLVDVHRGRLHVPGQISQLIATLDKATGAELKKKPKVTQPGTVVRISVQMDSAVPLEAGQRIILRAAGETVAAGLIE